RRLFFRRSRADWVRAAAERVCMAVPYAYFLCSLFFACLPKGLGGLSTFSIQGGEQRLWVLSPAPLVQAV
ncbi:MAG: hypothetical protein ACFNVM_07530, partial [Neisseria elongata]